MKESMRLEQKVRQFIQQQELLEKGDRIVVGLSGGADSVCLMLLLLALQKSEQYEIFAVHVNHQIRGEEAIRDQRFVEKFCQKHHITLEVIEKDIPKIAKEQGISEEEAGRKMRYACMEEKAKSLGGAKIAVAHHKNDQAETVLHHLCRGTGITGLTGMSPKRGLVVRPLLVLTREEIERYLQLRSQGFCQDSTNAKNIYTRNRLRNEIIPMLKETINPKTVEHIVDTASQLSEIEEFLERMGKNAFVQWVEKKEDGRYCLDLSGIQTQDVVLQKWIIKKILELLSDTHKDFTQQHILSIIELMEKQTGRRVELPYAIQVRREYEKLVFERNLEKKEEKDRMIPILHEMYLIDEPKECMEGWIVTKKYRYEGMGLFLYASIFEVQEYMEGAGIDRTNIPKNNCTKWFDYDKIENTVVVRTMRKTDFLQIDKAGHHKSAYKVCKDAKIPAGEREHRLVIAEGEQIMWIPFVRNSEYYNIGTDTKRILEIIVQTNK